MLQWIESLALPTWVRESDSILAYAGILFLHTLGLGIVVGVNTAVALASLRRRNANVMMSTDVLFSYMWAGLWVNVASGLLLVMADATTKLTNPVFYVKMGFVILAVSNMAHFRRRLRSGHPARMVAAASLLLWAGAITAGRLMAYLGPVSGAPDLTN